MVSIELEGGFARCATLLDNLQLFVQAVSLGDLESRLPSGQHHPRRHG